MERQHPNRFWLTADQQLGFQEFACARCYVFPPRLQDEYVVVIPLDGQVLVQEGSRVERVAPGGILVGNSRHWRGSRYGASGACHGVTVIASRRLVQALMVSLGHLECRESIVPAFHGVVRMPEMMRAAGDVLSELGGRGLGRDYLLELLAREMLVRALRAWPNVTMQAVSCAERVLSRKHYVSALVYMQHSGKSEFSVARLGNEVGLSPEEFTRLFRNSTGTTPLSAYNQLLIGRANDLFHSGAGSVKEVAALLQFDSVSHFSSLYKKVTGHAPTAPVRSCLRN